MDMINVVESYVQRTVQSFEAQLISIAILDYHHPDRVQLIENLRRMILGFSALLEVTRDSFIQELEKLGEQRIYKTAKVRDHLIMVNKRERKSDTEESARSASEHHDLLVKALGEREIDLEEKIIERFERMDGVLQDLLSQISNLQRR